jgi:hypothetical protein
MCLMDEQKEHENSYQGICDSHMRNIMRFKHEIIDMHYYLWTLHRTKEYQCMRRRTSISMQYYIKEKVLFREPKYSHFHKYWSNANLSSIIN